MLFGLHNAAQTFQRFIDEVLQELPFCYAYINYVLITSQDAKEHKLHLKQILQRFTKYGILLNPSKCEFGMHRLTFLGHRLNSIECLEFSTCILARVRDEPILLFSHLFFFLAILFFPTYFAQYLAQNL